MRNVVASVVERKNILKKKMSEKKEMQIKVDAGLTGPPKLNATAKQLS